MDKENLSLENVLLSAPKFKDFLKRQYGAGKIYFKGPLKKTLDDFEKTDTYRYQLYIDDKLLGFYEIWSNEEEGVMFQSFQGFLSRTKKGNFEQHVYIQDPCIADYDPQSHERSKEKSFGEKVPFP